METRVRKQVYLLLVCVVVIFASAILANWVERDFGKVDVQLVRIIHPQSWDLMTAKLYRPVDATAENKMPAVLALHGYQNDKDTQGAFAIELARRGFVVLALDQLAHGSSDGNYAPPDTTGGGDAAFKYLKTLAYVDAKNIGIMGHSMGARTALNTAAANPDHRAVNPQCGTAGTPDLKNVLLTQARFEEFRGFRENQPRVEPLSNNANRIKAFGLTTGPAEWNTTYGDFAKGTARRQALIDTVHPGVTHDGRAVAETLEWMRMALKEGKTDKYWIPADQHIYMWKEFFTLLALIVTGLSIIPLANILLARPYFQGVAQPMPSRYTTNTSGWLILALVNNLIAGVTYVLFTSGDWRTQINRWLPSWMSLSMTNGVTIWFIVNALIYAVLFYLWYRGASKKGVTMYDVGISFDQHKTVIDWGLIKKTVLLAAILFGWMYLLEFIAETFLATEFRFLWPFMRQFTPRRFAYFWIYLAPAVAFFILNGGILMFGQARQKEWGTPAMTQVMWWLKNCFFALFGLFIVWCIQYVPYIFMGMPPGFEALGFPQYGQMWPLMLFVFIPEFAFLLFLNTWFYRRTGRVYLGALIVAAMAIWFTTAGTVIHTAP